MSLIELDPFDARIALDAVGLMKVFNAAGVIAAADVHVASRLGVLLDEQDEAVLLGAALAVRGPRLGHVYVDLATIAQTAAVETEESFDLTELPWPPAGDWLGRMAASPLVAVGEAGDDPGCPLRLVDSRLYLDRYWREERTLAADLEAFGAEVASGADHGVLAEGVQRVFAGQTDDRQALAAATAVMRRLTVVAGGPGTGKTTTVSRIVALLLEQADAGVGPPPQIALTAPTGKAAARLEEAIHHEAAELDVDGPIRESILELRASTLHRLLGWRPDSQSRFRHNRGNRLPHDVVIVDETSMVSLSLMSRLVEAVRPDARLILVGDPGQLTSIEAGAVLGDLVGPAASGLIMRPEAVADLEAAVGGSVQAAAPPEGVGIGDGIVVLERVHRFGGGIAKIATAIRDGAGDAVIELLAGNAEDVTWLPLDVAEVSDSQLVDLRDPAVGTARTVIDAAAAGDASEALQALGSFRVLCAHRRGSYGASEWMARIERWLAAEIPDFDAGRRWYVGRPLVVTQNDYSLKLYNGDTGVVIAPEPERMSVAFERSGEVVQFSPSRLDAVDTVYAMTIHKSQGSQFDVAAVVLPSPTSRILTRELLYTAVTRASKRLIIAGTEETIRSAIARPAARASALRERLWSPTAGS